jgi:hypothetical protein
MSKLSRSNHWRQKTQLSANDWSAMLLIAGILIGIAIGITVLLVVVIKAFDKLIG